MSLPITEPCRLFRVEVFDRWPQLVDLGYYNRRKIRPPSSAWSQHAYGNAQDLGGDVQRLDLVAAWLDANRRRLNIRTLLWRVANHFDHIHVDFNPKRGGVPPYPTEDEDDMETNKGIQRSLNAAGFRDQTGAPLTVDGQWGPKTEYAYARMCAAAASGAPLHAELIIESGRLKVREVE